MRFLIVRHIFHGYCIAGQQCKHPVNVRVTQSLYGTALMGLLLAGRAAGGLGFSYAFRWGRWTVIYNVLQYVFTLTRWQVIKEVLWRHLNEPVTSKQQRNYKITMHRRKIAQMVERKSKWLANQIKKLHKEIWSYKRLS